jgi:hypothetical protein
MTNKRLRARTYQCWSDMKQRCYNPKAQQYKNYGARGIFVCSRWLESFDNFVADMSLKPDGMTLERVDNNGYYCLSNCIWATKQEQRLNQRRCRYLEYDGLRMTLRDWSKKLGIHETTLHGRLKRGLSVAETLSTPVDAERSRRGIIGLTARHAAIAAQGGKV